MPWGRCDDTHYDHPKVSALPAEIRNAADGLYWRAISYSNRHLTDGRVPVEVLISVLDGTSELVEALRKVRLFDRAGGSAFRIHNFHDFNPTREDVLSERTKHSEARAAAGRLGGIASGIARRSKPPKQPRSKPPANEAPSRPVEKENVSPSATKPGKAGAPVEVNPIRKNGLLPPEDEQLIERAQAIWQDKSYSDDLRMLARERLDNLGVKV